MTASPRQRRRRLLSALAVYLALLAASHAIQLARSEPNPQNLQSVQVSQATREGPDADATQRIAYRRWSPETPQKQAVPVILLHGSPGNSSNFTRLGPELARLGFDCLAPDLPGFGQSTADVPDYSILAHAYSLRVFMNELGIDRAHLAAWSQGGGVALHLADLEPDRVATITLMGAIGDQRAEGSGSYHFEHAKYALGYAALVLGAEAIPHFGVLGTHAQRHAFIRNFYDSDQRPLRDIMRRLDTPTLILHGDDDFLTPAWGAKLHHQQLRNSKLVMFDASHFLPILQHEAVAERMDRFLTRHAEPTGATFFREFIDLSPPPATLGQRLDMAVQWALPRTPWWPLGVVLALLAWRRPEPAAALAAFLVAMVWTDAGLAAAALFAGLLLRSVLPPRTPTSPSQAVAVWMGQHARARFSLPLITRLQPWRRDRAARTAARAHPLTIVGLLSGAALWTAAAFIPALITASILRNRLGDSLPVFAVILIAALLVARGTLYVITWQGRQRLKAVATRTVKHEFWPGWAYYAPLVPWLLWHGIRHGFMAFTRVNPAIPAGGGVVGESKREIQRALDPLGDRVLAATMIEPGDPGDRLDALRAAMRDGALRDTYPVVLKPDAGQRGYAVRVARTDADALAYLTDMPRPVIAQAYHPGPIELGVMWVRDPRPTDNSDRLGRVFSVTHKQFPKIVGDGAHTLEQLIYRHRRFRCQADMLLDRFATRRLDVLTKGEALPVTNVGNHSKGAVFVDAAELITPGFEAWVDHAAGDFRGSPPPSLGLPAEDNGLDICRLDIRAHSLDDVRAGRDMAIIELNGSAAESTNIFDPYSPLWWSWSVLLRHWALLYRLGGRRRAMGVPGLSPLGLLRAWREYDADRPDVRVGA